MKRLFLLTLFLSFLGACATQSTTTTSGGTEGTTDPSITALGTQANLTFTFEIQIKSDSDSSIDFDIPFPSSYTVPLYVDSDGTVSMQAGDFPRMVYRVCKTDSTTSGCMSNYSGATFDVDVVIDSCGTSVTDTNCGDADGTVYTGILGDDGSIYINALSMRMRLFAATSSVNGYTATDGNSGLAVLSRMSVNISTANVASGTLSASGSPIDADNKVTLVSAGLIPSDIAVIGDAHYLSSLAGTFDMDPLSLLQ